MKLLLRIANYIKPYWIYILLGSVSMLFFALTNSAMVYIIAPVIRFLFYPAQVSKEIGVSMDHIQAGTFFDKLKTLLRASYDKYLFSGNPLEILARFCLILLALMLIKNLCFWLQAFFSSYALESIIRDIRLDLYRHLQSLSMSFFNRHRTGELISRIINDTGVMNEMISLSFSNFIRDPILILVYFVFLLVLNWKLTLIILIGLPPVVFGMDRLGKHLRRYSKKCQERMADLYTHLQESLAGIKITKVFGAKETEISRFKKHLQNFFKINLKRIWVQKLSTPFNELVGTAIAVFILWYGGREVLLDKTIRPEEFIQYIFALFMIMQPLKALSNDYTSVMQGLAAAERIFSLMDTKPDISSQVGARKAEHLREKIVFENVSFAYGAENESAIEGVSFELRKGEHIAIVGPSGGGKTTIIDLMLRLYDPQEGAIYLDGTDIREFELWSYRSLFGVVTQDVILFYDTVKGNIAYGKPDATMDEIIESAKIANAHKFIMALPLGYDTIIGERGITLSGGERQRIAIARAILKNPEIIIFDEATSSLDTESERLIQEAIERLIKNRTVVTVAHRLSTVKEAHRILVIDKGRIVEEGNHESLMRTDGLYRLLYSIQFKC